jgi:Putative Ig domain
MNSGRITLALLTACLLGASLPALDAATIIIVNKDAAGVGFNDTTPATPVGGNAGTTLGAQRLNVFNAAAAIWGAKLSSTVTIRIAADFGPLTPCNATSGILGSAGPTTAFYGFPNAPQANTWYPIALASALSGMDLATTYGYADGASILAHFNSSIGTATCLTGTSWYLGLDANHGSQLDLETVLLHEFGHGLGFIGLVSLDTGALAQGLPDVFSTFTFDNVAGLHWNVMSDAQRVASAINTGNIVFDGPKVRTGASILSAGKDGLGHPELYAPATLAIGSSVYHYDTTATPNQLMEPYINGNLTHNVDLPNDLTAQALFDMGWQGAACPAITVSPATLPNGTVSAAYNQTITAAGGTAAYTYTVTAGSLPPGITLTAAGVLSGTPTHSGTYSPTITATDANACTGNLAYTITIACPGTISLAPATLINATFGVAYNQAITASGGIAVYTYAVTAGTLPTGMTLSAAGAFSGTPTQRGTFNFTVTSTDSAGCSGSKAYSLVVNCPIITLSPASSSTLSVTVNVAYSRTMTASGGAAAYTYALTTGTLPTGLSLSTGGVISGTTSQTGTFPLTITATDANSCTGSASYSLVVSTAPPCTPGDANGDSAVTVGDVFYLINYLFAGGPAPQSIAPKVSALSRRASSPETGQPTATLRLGTATGVAGGTVSLPVVLRGAAEIDALSLQVHYTASAVRSITIRRAGVLAGLSPLLEARPQTAGSASFIIMLGRPLPLEAEALVAEIEIVLSDDAGNGQPLALVFDRDTTALSNGISTRIANGPGLRVEDGSIAFPAGNGRPGDAHRGQRP